MYKSGQLRRAAFDLSRVSVNTGFIDRGPPSTKPFQRTNTTSSVVLKRCAAYPQAVPAPSIGSFRSVVLQEVGDK